jgi:hypothetical protein
MENLKEEAINVISKLPDTVKIDDIMYELYVIDKVNKGKEAADKGKTTSIDTLREEMKAL